MTIEGSDLAIGYPDRLVGTGLNVRIDEGEVLALLGPNGGGKTTLLKTLLGLIPPRGGVVRVINRARADLPVVERARLIGYVPQVHHGTFAFTVETVVLMGRTAHGSLFAAPTARDREVSLQMLERFGIGALASRAYTEISGGERQLVLLARALAQEPRFVVLDEPTASLDFGNQGKVMREIRLLAESGLGVLFTTHDPNHAMRVATRVYLLRDGTCLAEGAVADVLKTQMLEQLYRAPVQTLHENSQVAFLPG